MTTARTFTTARRRLDRDSMPMRLYEKARKFGVWNPSEIDLTQDRADWLSLSPEEQELLLRLTAMFQAGEEAVTLDLLPLIQVIAQEGRLEEEIFLTSFLADEAKHTDFFSRVLDDVMGQDADLSRFHQANYQSLFYEALPQALTALSQDPSPAAQVRAAVTYNLIVEGVLAETGYHAYFQVLETRGLMPGQRQGIQWLKQDESRHIAYGVYLICRWIEQDPSLYDVAEEHLNHLLGLAIGVIQEIFDLYEEGSVPFGLTPETFTDFALSQFQSRLHRLEQAKEGGRVALNPL
jgi:ribonucleoside-diphosphate reductase beta chain